METRSTYTSAISPAANALLSAPLEAQQVLCPRGEAMAICAGHRHLRFARFLAVAFGVCSHLPTLGTRCTPVPLADYYVQLFGRHLNLLAPRCPRQSRRSSSPSVELELIASAQGEVVMIRIVFMTSLAGFFSAAAVIYAAAQLDCSSAIK